MSVHSMKHHFMHLGVLFEAMSDKRILFLAPDFDIAWEHYTGMCGLVRDAALPYSAKWGGNCHGQIDLQGRGSILFASEDRSGSPVSVDYAVYLGEPGAEALVKLAPAVLQRAGQVVFG